MKHVFVALLCLAFFFAGGSVARMTSEKPPTFSDALLVGVGLSVENEGPPRHSIWVTRGLGGIEQFYVSRETYDQFYPLNGSRVLIIVARRGTETWVLDIWRLRD